jgi:ubiquinone/menaquinone biosynthesis C-methylase UbiE
MIGDNIDPKTVRGFGQEWSVYDQSQLDACDQRAMFAQYFAVFPWSNLPPGAVGFDLGCGSGRWAKLVALRVGTLHCIDASEDAITVAKRNLAEFPNCRFHLATVDRIPFPNDSMDFAYSLGVLHHVPDTAAGIRSCVAKLKPGAPLLLYLYYAFDNRNRLFRLIWKVSNMVRQLIYRLPMGPKVAVTTAIAGTVYFPLARLASVLERSGRSVEGFPLSYYRHLSFYTMRTDAFDRFGTRLEQRFTAAQIRAMMRDAGLESITFSPGQPFWCAVGYKQ